MAITRAQAEKELVPGLKGLIGLEYRDYENEWQEVFDSEKSKRSFEEFQKLAGFGRAFTKAEGESVEFDEGAGEVWAARFVHNTWSMGFIITEEAIEDNLYDDLGRRYSKQLGRSMAKTKNYEGANTLNFAFTAGYTGGDGKVLCASDHPTKSGITNSNYAAVGTDLNEATAENAVIQIGQWVDERGMIIAAKPKKLIIPLALQFIAKRLMASPYRVGTADNDINAIKDMGIFPGGFTVNHYLTSPSAWFVKTDIPDGLLHLQRVPLETKKDGDFNTGNVKIKARERYSFGWVDPLGAWGSAGT